MPAAFLLVFFLWPVVALIRRALGVGADGLVELLGRTNAGTLLAVTVGQAAASAVVTAVVAAPIVWLYAHVGSRSVAALTVLVTVPFVLPTVVVGITFRALFDGPLQGLGIGPGLWPVLAAHIFLNVAIYVRIVGAAWRSLDRRAEDAARTLGASRWYAFRSVVAPRLVPAFASSAALVFLFCSTSFGVVLILGGTLRTLETEIYTQAIGYFRIPEAVALSMLQIVVVIAALLLTKVVTSPTADAAATGRRVAIDPGAGIRWAKGAVVAWSLLLLLGPPTVLVLRSVYPGTGGFTLAGYRSLGTPVNGIAPLSGLWYSLTTAMVAMVIALVIGAMAAWGLLCARGALRSVGTLVVMIPLGVSAVTLGFGYLIVLAALPRQVAASWWVVPCVQALIAIPVVVRILLPAFASVPVRQRQAAQVLGASPARVFATVDLPIVGRSVGAAAGFAFVMAVGEFGATSFLARADTMTLPVLIGSTLNRPGADQLATAMAASVTLMAATTFAVLLVEVLRPRRGGQL